MPRKLTQLVWLVVFCSAIFGISNLNAQDISGSGTVKNNPVMYDSVNEGNAVASNENTSEEKNLPMIPQKGGEPHQR